jgi:hypothetical protein
MNNTAPALASIIPLVFLAAQAQAQAPATLPPDHPDVYYSFFFFMEDFGKWLDLRATQAPERREALFASAARYLKVDAKELPALTSACQSVASSLRQINRDAHQYRTRIIAAGGKPDPAVTESYEASRQAAIQTGTLEIRSALSPASWSGLHSHINGTHRALIHAGK